MQLYASNAESIIRSIGYVVGSKGSCLCDSRGNEAEFLGLILIGTKFFLLAIHSHIYKRVLLPLPLSKSGL